MATKNLSAIVTFASTPSYSKTIWQGGDLITDIRLNNMEQGIENASSTVNATQANTTKAYVLGRDASSGAGMDEAVYDSGVYLGESAGTLHVDTTSFPAICATRSDGNAGNISIETVAGARDIWLGVGSGGSNRGIYDQENSKWLVYFDSSNEGHLNGGATSADSLNVSDAGSSQTPVYFKDGVPVACSFSGGSGGSSGGNVYYGTCSTAAATDEKVVTLSGDGSFSLETGTHLVVNFTYNNSADNPTLNVNSVGARSILGHNGSSNAVYNVKSWISHSMVEFVYDGTYWVIVSIGCKSTASGLYADSVCQSSASGDYSHSEGYSTASGDYSHSEGYTIASGRCSHSEGGWIDSYPEAKGFASHVEGADTVAEGDYAHAEGGKNTALGTASHAEGYDTTAGVADDDGKVSGSYSHAEGICGTASGTASHVEGGYDSSLSSPVYNEASGGASHAEGCGTTASGNYGSHAEGEGGTASGRAAHVEGGGTYTVNSSNFHSAARGDYSHVEGFYNEVVDLGGHAEGGCNGCSGDYSHVEGYFNETYGEASHAEGGYNLADGGYSHVEGYGNHAQSTGAYAHVEGSNNTVSGAYAHAEGSNNTVSGAYAHAEGFGNITESNGGTSNSMHAEGYETQATNGAAHSEGYYTFAQGTASHAEGCNNYATGDYTHVQGYGNTVSTLASSASGTYNNDTENNLLTIGNGSSENDTSNALRVTVQGETYTLNATNNSGADYAEFIKPWADGNENNEDRVGYFVTIKDGMLYKANPGEYIAGITSGNPSVVGNSDETYYWRYERDEFNRLIWEEVELSKFNAISPLNTSDDENVLNVPSEEDIPNPPDISQDYKVLRPKQSENYDVSLCSSYISRKDRSEWDYVGMIGVLPVRDDGTCEVGQFCKCGEGGIATLAEERGFDTYMVIERKTDNVVSVILK